MTCRRRDSMQRRTTTTSPLRQINRSAVVGLVRKENVVTPSSLATSLNISNPTVMRVIEGLIAGTWWPASSPHDESTVHFLSEPKGTTALKRSKASGPSAWPQKWAYGGREDYEAGGVQLSALTVRSRLVQHDGRL